MTTESTYTFKHFFQDIFQGVLPYKKKFFIGVFLRLTSDIARLYPVWAISVIIPLLTTAQNEALLSTLITLLVFWILTVIYAAFMHDFSKYLGNQVAESVGLDLYKKCLAHVFRLDLSWQELEGSGNKMKRIDRGRDGMNQMIRRIFSVLIEAVVNTVGIVLIFFTLQRELSISLIFFIITFFLLGTYLLKRPTRQEKIVNIKNEAFSGITFESLNNIQTIKSLGIDQGIFQVVVKQAAILKEEIRKRILYFRIQSGALETYYVVFEFAMVCFIIWNIILGNYTVSLLVLFIGMYQKVGQSTSELTEFAQEMVISKIWVSRAKDLLLVTPVIENEEKAEKQSLYPKDWTTLRLQNIHFAYARGQALTDISLDIKRGESIGIVGLSGAGKSTLFKLLLDLYEDYEGEIMLDDLPLKQIKRQSYIDHVAVVLQDTELFNMTLGENITLAKIHGRATNLTLKDTIKMAHLEDVMTNLSHGLDTMVGEKGVKLSGGQRQRVGIARALFRQPDILLLDEATSHLDGQSEKQIQQALSEVMHNFTTIVIAHRLSTIQKMDRIVVLEKGKIQEVGSFKELLELKGSFAKMWKEQKL